MFRIDYFINNHYDHVTQMIEIHVIQDVTNWTVRKWIWDAHALTSSDLTICLLVQLDHTIFISGTKSPKTKGLKVSTNKIARKEIIKLTEDFIMESLCCRRRCSSTRILKSSSCSISWENAEAISQYFWNQNTVWVSEFAIHTWYIAWLSILSSFWGDSWSDIAWWRGNQLRIFCFVKLETNDSGPVYSVASFVRRCTIKYR